jgi:hypothetical protein
MGTAAPTDSRPYLNSETSGHLIREWKDSGLSSFEFALRQGVSEKTLLQWERRLRSAPDTTVMTPAFVQVQRMPCAEITVHCQGVSIQGPLAALELSLPIILRAARC